MNHAAPSATVSFAPGGFERIGPFLTKLGTSQRLAIITDREVERHLGRAVIDFLRRAGLEGQLIPVPAGESSATLSWAERLYTRLSWGRFGPDSNLVSLGGAVVCDLTGFVAATYRGGLRWVQVPTTLFSQVEAGLPGPSRLNHKLGYGMIAVDHPPRAILVDPELLSTLPEPQWRSGLAAMIRFAYSCDPQLLDAIEAWSDRPDWMEVGPTLNDLMQRILLAQAEHPCDDHVTGSSLASATGFGETVAQALEVATDYRRFSRGESLALGMRTIARLSLDRGTLAENAFDRLERLLAHVAPPPLDIDVDAVLTVLARDAVAESVPAVLPEGPGRLVGTSVTLAELRAALEILRESSP